MPLSLDQYRAKLIEKILSSESKREVERYCGSALASLVKHKVHDFIISRFLAKTAGELRAFVLKDRDSSRCAHILFAIEFIDRLSRIPFISAE